MARPGWLGIPTFTSPSFVPGVGRLRSGEREGLVLSGGGSKASFQIGALRYLYDEVGIAPSTIVGTSAGAILTAMLGQSSEAAQQAEAVRELERLWLGMSRQSDMFAPRTWFRRFRERGPELLELVRRDEGRELFGGVRRLPRINLPFTQGFSIDPDQDETGTSPTQPPVREELTPELQTLAAATHDPEPEAPELTATQVMGLLAGLSRMRGLSQDLGIILTGAQKTHSMYVPGPLLRELLGSGMFTSARVAASGVEVRIAMVALESGELRFMRQDGVLVTRQDVPIGAEAHDFSRGVLASCSIPAVFRPVALGDEHYIDGGVRENVPAEMAIGQLGCTRTWVVTSNAPNVQPRESFADKDLFSIMLRAAEIGSDETERDEVAYARSAGAIVIEPELDVHDSLTIDPGLIRLNIDYGWMRAAEVHHGATVAEQALNRSIVQARRRAWELERNLLDQATPHDEREMLLLARLKYDLREQVPRVRPELLPPGADQWWTRWEGHPEAPTTTPPWMV